jgi:hypothetical protein
MAARATTAAHLNMLCARKDENSVAMVTHRPGCTPDASRAFLFSTVVMTDNTLPSVAERLRMMRPSQELVDFYRAKIHQYDTERGDIMRKLETLRAAFDEQV